MLYVKISTHLMLRSSFLTGDILLNLRCFAHQLPQREVIRVVK